MTKFTDHINRTIQAIHALLDRQQRCETVESGTGVVEYSKGLMIS